MTRREAYAARRLWPGDDMQDQTPQTWTDAVTLLNDANFNTEIRDAALLMLNPPSGSIRRGSGSQSIPANTLTVVVMDTLNFDTEDPATPMWSAANPSRLTVTTPGWYECVATAEWTVTSGATFTAGFRINGSTLYWGSSVSSNPALGFLDNSPVNLIAMNPNDYIELVVTHNASSAQVIAQSFFLPGIAISRRRGL